MNSSNAKSEMTPQQKKARTLSLLTTVLCIAAVLVGSRMMKAQEGFPLGDFSGVSAETTQAAYEESGDVQDLIHHLKVLCYQAEVEGNEAVEADIALYGTELLDMAKAETIDLEELGEKDETLLDLLKLIRGYGAK